MARKSKYKQEYNQMMLDYFNVNPFTMQIEEKELKSGEIGARITQIPVELPTFERFALMVDVSRDTLHEWAKEKNREKHPLFSDTYKTCKHLQENILIQNGLSGLYKYNFAVFLARNILRKRKITVKNTEPLEIQYRY